MGIDLKTIADRLRKTREVLAYSIEEASQATGVSARRIDEIESGKSKPSGDEVLILASLYSCDFRALLDDALPPPAQQSDILFRRYGESLDSNDRRAIQEFLYLCQVEAALQHSLGQEQTRPFSFRPTGTYFKGHGQQAAEELRRTLGYEDNEVRRDIYSDFRSFGVHVFRRKLLNEEISGLYIEDPVAGHCVLINYNEDIYRQRFSVAHEVAHAIFDSSDGVVLTYDTASSKYDQNDCREIRANSFASHYLMPLTMLRRLPRLDASSALHWAQQFRVSTSALAKALKDARLIDETAARTIRSVRVSKNEKIDPETPESLTASQRDRRKALLERGLSDHYVGVCFDAHDRGLISTGRLAEALRADHAELPEIGSLYGRTIGHGV